MEALTCPSRTDVGRYLSTTEVTSTALTLRWSPSGDPNFVSRKLMYGALKCQDCQDDTFQKALTSIDNCKIIDWPVPSHDVNVTTRLSELAPRTNYRVCVYDSLQRPANVESQQCITITTTSADDASPAALEASNWPPTWFWALVCILAILMSASCVMALLWKKKMFFRAEKGGNLYKQRNNRDEYFDTARWESIEWENVVFILNCIIHYFPK